jgi:Ser-tRNA(Ala) deacylase AlaX
MATKLLYLDDFEVVNCEALLLQVYELEDGRSAVVLDQTCFYPRGGGQDWDMGNIASPQAKFEVDEVRLDETGTVLHVGIITAGTFSAGDKVACMVDTTRRAINTRLHSAGHLLDKAVNSLELGWVPGKGAHYPHMSFVEYEADVVVDDALIVRLQAEVDQQAASTYENKILFVPVAEMGRYCRYIPANIPTNKPARVVLYADDFGIPCGGTHVRNVKDIGKIMVTKVKSKKGITKVSYCVEGIS